MNKQDFYQAILQDLTAMQAAPDFDDEPSERLLDDSDILQEFNEIFEDR